MKTTVVAGVAALGIATAGIGWAWFTENATAEAAGGAGGNLLPLATGTSAQYVYDTGHNGLFPNKNADVKITVTNPAENGVTVVVGDVVPAATNPKSVTALTPASVNTESNRNTCAGWLAVNANPNFAPESGDLELAPGDSVALVLSDAVALDYQATNICQGMTFTTQWDVVSENR